MEPFSLLFEGTLLGSADQVGTVQVGRQGNTLLDKTKLELIILITGLLIFIFSGPTNSVEYCNTELSGS